MPPQYHSQPTERLHPSQVQPTYRQPTRGRLTLITLMVLGVATLTFLSFTTPWTALILGFGAALVWLVAFIFVLL